MVRWVNLLLVSAAIAGMGLGTTKTSAGSPLASAAPLSSPTEYKLEVLTWSCTQTGGWIVAQGVVRNISNQTLSGLRAHLRVIGSGRRLLGTNSSPIGERFLLSGQQSPFRVEVRSRGVGDCDLWFRNALVVQIPTKVPPPRLP
ncbi:MULTISPECIES: hypothetical protein [unclassified Meiothermus]|uniref:hypothetical protein n=1 Tax=unclassified Meiothermus TaxID=370471 RepID=UPI000D7C93B4|nr:MULTISPECIES: hypothetical protein [unclassified Meiothermus]PZA06655.1 hypothetical protein DNA98_11710 [Meiothermus sp. Pnk-1]RYM29174.1 hypothetical protein EWH23_16225 [Meiothermus sp. PNK-Is4]